MGIVDHIAKDAVAPAEQAADRVAAQAIQNFSDSVKALVPIIRAAAEGVLDEYTITIRFERK